jgi:hypothetical protein
MSDLNIMLLVDFIYSLVYKSSILCIRTRDIFFRNALLVNKW